MSNSSHIQNENSGVLSVLIVEDNFEYLHFLKKSLSHASKQNINIDTSRTLSGATNLISKNKYDVIILDLFILDSKGETTFHKIKEHASQIPIILLTGIDNEELSKKMLLAGAQDYFVKTAVTSSLILNSIKHSIIRKKMEMDLLKLQEIKDQFIAKAVHEIRTPVSVIKACMDNLQTRSKDNIDSDVSKFFTVAFRNSERLCRLSENLLSLNNLEDNNQELNFSDFNLIQLIEEYVNCLEVSQVCKNVKLHHSFETEIKDIHGDKDSFYQVINNIISNSLRYANSNIWIKSYIKKDEDSNFLHIEIADDGPGISDDKKEKIFERLYKMADKKSQYKGSGLGLYICKLIVEKHGGKIWADNSPKGGACFCFEIPIRIMEKETSSTHPKKLKILLVEDDINTASILKKRLKSEGYEIFITNDVETSIDLLAQYEFNLVLLDLSLKKFDGTTLLQRIRFNSDKKTSQIPIIIVSGVQDPEVIDFVLDAGASSYISKPYDYSFLIKNIQQQLN